MCCITFVKFCEKMVPRNSLRFIVLVLSLFDNFEITIATTFASEPKPKPPPPPPRKSDGNDHGGNVDDTTSENYCTVHSYRHFEQCGTNGLNDRSFCAMDIDGAYVCYRNHWCDSLTMPCETNADCSEGYACSISCGSTLCAPLCSNLDDPLGPHDIDAPYYNDADGNICWPSDYVASVSLDTLPLDEDTVDTDRDSPYSYYLKHLQSTDSSSRSNLNDLTSYHIASRALVIIACIVVVAVFMVPRFAGVTASPQFTELSSSSEHSMSTVSE